MKIIEQSAVITDLIDTASAIQNLLGDRFALVLADAVTDTPRVLVALADTDGSNGYLGVTVTGPGELVIA